MLQQQFDRGYPPVTQTAWEKLLAFIPLLERSAPVGQWKEGSELIAGVYVMPDVNYEPIIHEFIRTAYASGVITQVDWMNWPEQTELLQIGDETLLQQLGLNLLRDLLTAILRQDRFVDGWLLAKLTDGTVLRILRALRYNVLHPLITDRETTRIYFADRLQRDFPELFLRLIHPLDAFGISYTLLPAAEDIWCRDYMPVQVKSDKFVRFRYTTDQSALIPESIRSKTVSSDLRLDGGNIVKGPDRVALTDRVFDDNDDRPRQRIVEELQEIFETRSIIVVPQLPYEEFGHIDGMLRFLDANTVLVSDFKQAGYPNNFLSEFDQSLTRAGLKQVKFPYQEIRRKNHEGVDSAAGCYINYLQVGEKAVLPVFEAFPTKNEAARSILEAHFKVETLECTQLADEGGVLNCVSWNIW